jgi:hypothetical protein
VASFEEIMAAQPTAWQNATLTNVMSGAQIMGGVFGLVSSVSNLGRGGSGAWGGQAQTAQAGQAGNLLSSGQQVLGALAQTQATIMMGGMQMQMAKMRLTQLVTQARTEGFIVSAGGTVTLAPWMYDVSNARTAAYKARAVTFNAQIQAVVFQTTAADIAVGLSLAKTGVDILNSFIKKDSGAGPTTATPGGTGPPGSVWGPGGNQGTGSLASGGPLAGYPGGGFGPGYTGIPGQLGGPMGVGPMAGVQLGPNGLPLLRPGLASGGAAMAGGGGAGAAGARGAAGSSSSVMGMGGAPVGGAGAGREEDREATGWLLSEDDEEVFAPGDIPDSTDGVLS